MPFITGFDTCSMSLLLVLKLLQDNLTPEQKVAMQQLGLTGLFTQGSDHELGPEESDVMSPIKLTDEELHQPEVFDVDAESETLRDPNSDGCNLVIDTCNNVSDIHCCASVLKLSSV
jgi:hypothetical protein